MFGRCGNLGKIIKSNIILKIIKIFDKNSKNCHFFWNFTENFSDSRISQEKLTFQKINKNIILDNCLYFYLNCRKLIFLSEFFFCYFPPSYYNVSFPHSQRIFKGVFLGNDWVFILLITSLEYLQIPLWLINVIFGKKFGKFPSFFK